ncbi:hypothetical protein KCP74_06885 [Salmonella enterica subsp. enterica]|nr:hypothetical protein KCP74_06885 [Salmonella enterica subsp. enterica]
MESIARSVREPLSSAILKADLPNAKPFWKVLNLRAWWSAPILVPKDPVRALRKPTSFLNAPSVMVTRLFRLPVQNFFTSFIR